MQALGEAWLVQAQSLAELHKPAESRAAFDKMLQGAEAYLRDHPEDEQAWLAVADAYNESASMADERLSNDAEYARASRQYERSIWAAEKLVSLQKNNLRYRGSLAAARRSLAITHFEQGKFAAAAELLQLAAPVFAERATDSKDANAVFRSAYVDVQLANALLKTGALDEALPYFQRSAAILDRLARAGGNLRVTYAQGDLGRGLGELQEGLAARAGVSVPARQAHWRQARSAYQLGLESYNAVSAKVPFDAKDQLVIDACVAGLARANKALAESGP
jgi:tetratricopeptide (TPR) repeat protein